MKCPVCGHSHSDKWNPRITDWDDSNTKEFVELSVKGLVVCPKCGVVLMKEMLIKNMDSNYIY